jgi:hypothetical protein
MKIEDKQWKGVNMNKDNFKQWLADIKEYESGTINSRITNCLKVERYEGDLDEHYNTDCGCRLLEKLAYSTADERKGESPKHNIPIAGNKCNGSATLKSAIKLYIDFRRYESNPLAEQSAKGTYDSGRISIEKTPKRVMSKKEWVSWELPNEDEFYALAQISMRYVRFLNPEIVELIVKDNKTHNEEWRDKLLATNINPDLYLWEDCSCCFPGVRRYAGSTEIAEHRKRKEASVIPDALKLDDNDFPKQVWSFVFRGTYFNKFGPPNYSLAHLIDHKKANNRMGEELISDKKELNPLYGLYTCPTNTVFIPNALLKPTDFNKRLRRLLDQKAEVLYKNYCQLLPNYLSIPETNANDKWNVNNFEWADCVGSTDNIKSFLEFRNKKMNEILFVKDR